MTFISMPASHTQITYNAQIKVVTIRLINLTKVIMKFITFFSPA
jgi:hypothetical protein